MTWFRTKAGRLVFAPDTRGEGGLAAVYRARQLEVVPDDVAHAEVQSGQAQDRADADGAASAEVDARTPIPGKPGVKTVVPVDVPGVGQMPLTVTIGGTPDVDPEHERQAQQALAEEAPRVLGGPVTDGDLAAGVVDSAEPDPQE